MGNAIRTLVLCSMLVACGDDKPDVVAAPERDMATLAGVVVLRERVGLTRDSRLELEIAELAASGSSDLVVLRKTISQPGQGNLAFSIEYDAELIDADRGYVIAAKVFDRDHLIFASTGNIPVLTKDGSADVVINAVRVSTAQ